MYSLIRRATQVAIACTIAFGALSAAADSAEAVVFCQKGKNVKVRALGCKKKETRLAQGLDPIEAILETQVELEDLMHRMANPDIYDLILAPAESTDSVTIPINGKDFCSLSRVHMTAGAPGTNRWCEVTPGEGAGQWLLYGRTYAGGQLECRAVCF